MLDLHILHNNIPNRGRIRLGKNLILTTAMLLSDQKIFFID